MTVTHHHHWQDQDYDVIVVGAGLASSLTALRLKAKRPDLNLCLLEAASGPDETHTWCCFDSDLGVERLEWMRPLMANHWDGYDVAFPKRHRHLTTGYGRITSKGLARARDAHLPNATHYGAEVKHLGPHHAILAGGRTLSAPLILDGRGTLPSATLELGYQKFVGIEVQTQTPHGLIYPLIMDATVNQIDGYRFVYVLPLDEKRLLIEDTRYSDGPDLDPTQLGLEIRDYAHSKGWSIKSEERSETGVLPILLNGDFDTYWADLSGAVPLGMRALMFHATTGYSLPQAARLADLIADHSPLDTESLRAVIEQEARSHWKDEGFLRLLNRMMFKAAEPDQRYRVLQRFYGLPHDLIERFYAGQLSFGDRVRLLAGKPPVPLLPALKALNPQWKSQHG